MESCSNIFISMATQLDFSLTEKLTLNEKYKNDAKSLGGFIHRLNNKNHHIQQNI